MNNIHKGFSPNKIVLRSISDDAFSTGTGLKCAGFAGQSADSGRWTHLQKQETKRIGGGLARCLSDA